MTLRPNWRPPLALSAGFVLAASPAASDQARPRQAWERYPALIVGKWQLRQDPRSVLLVTRTTYQEKYPGLPDSKLTYRLTNACPNPDAPKLVGRQKDIVVTYDVKNKLSYCYGIDELTFTRLTLVYLGRGNFLRFKRIR